ncbi:MAG: S-layer homology domain-containing protein [Clostridia bacterium]|nr:S-layer homology domain-containing protein [Clostridia bacterium]
MKKVLSLVLCILLILPVFPANISFAEDADAFEVTTTKDNIISYSKKLTVSFSNEIDSSTVSPETVKLYADGVETNLSPEDISVSANTVTINIQKYPYVKYKAEFLSEICDVNETKLGKDVLINFETNAPEKTGTIPYSSIKSAMYDFVDGSVTTEMDKYGMLRFYKVIDGKVVLRNHYYVSVDISSFAGKTVTDAKFNIHVNGRALMTFYKADANFIPGETAYEDMPKITDNMSEDDVICSYSQSSGNLNTLLDMTAYMNECLDDGKTHMNFMVDQGSTSTFGVAPEQGDSSYRPFMNISYAESEFPVVTSTTPAAWETSMPCEGEIMFSLSDCAIDVSSENIILLNNENNEQLILEEESVAYDSEKKTVTLSAFEPLSPQTVYTLEISGLKTDLGKSFADKKVKFKTGGTREELYYSKPSETSFVKVNIADDYSGAVVISGKFFALSDAPVSIDVVNAEGESIYFENVTCDEYGYFSFDVSSDYSGICKAYVSSEKNLGNNIETDEFEIYSVSEFMSVWENLGSGDKIKIADSIESAFSLFEIGNGKKTVFEKGDALVEVIADSGSFGEYNYENIIAMKDFVFENYIICGFASEVDEKLVREAIEEYASEMDFASLENFGKYKVMDDNSKEATAKIFSEAKSSDKDTKEKIRKLLGECITQKELLNVFEKIENASNHTEVSKIILDEYYANLLGLSDDNISDYKANKKNAGKALVGKSFDSKEDFKKAFNKAVEAENPRETGGGGGGGSSFGGSSVVIKVDSESKPQPEQNPVVTTGDNDEKVQPSSYSFTDIAHYPWAVYEIEFLARMNVINGVGEGIYAPSGNVTREQSAKLLVQAMEFETINHNPGFSDADPDAWYYPYISTASSRGIVKGKGDIFGIGENVTREDLCTMAARTLEAAGYKIDECHLSFTDSSEVSDYAKNAVAFLANAGIIKGMPDGSFMPKNNTTRAEAAVFIYRFCEYVKTYSATIWEKPLEAVKKIEAPSEEQILSDIKSKFNKKEVNHPFIFGNDQKIEEIKTNLSSGDSYTKIMYGQVKKYADNFLNVPPVVHNGSVTQVYNYVDDRIMNLMIAYHIEGDEKYLNRAKEEFENFKKITRWDGGAQLENSQTGYALAVCYDWLYDYLTAEDRAWAEETIKVKMLEIAYKYYQNPDSYNELRSQYASMNIQCGNSTYNHSTYNNSNLFVAALALAPIYPEYSAYIMANNMKNVQPYIELIGPDGGFDEPVGYYSYKSPKIMQMLQACQSVLGTSYGYDRYEGFRSTSYYPLFMYGAGAFAFGDSGPGIASFDSNYMYYTAKYSKDSKLMSLVAEKLSEGDCAKALLCYESGDMNNVDKDASLPLDNVIYPLTKDQNVISMRNNWDIQKGLFTAMYAGCATANGHSDAVSGAFGIDAFGEIFVTAIGRGDYDYPGYWDNTQNGGRWDWYEKRPEGSNCLVINPSEKVGQDVSETAVIDVYESGEGAAFGVTDLSGVYKEYVTSYKRGLKLHDSRSKIVVQDEATMKTPSEIFWSINTPADIEIIDEDTVLLSIGAKMVAVKFYANVDFELFEMAAEKLPTSPQKAEQLRYRDYRKIALRAKDVTELKLMVEFVPVGAYSEALLPISEFIPIENWNVSEPKREFPKLSAITVDGEAIDGFDKDIHSYLIEFDTLPEKLPEIKATAENEADVTVTYSDAERKSAEIKVEKGDEVSWYEVIFIEEEKPFDVSGMKKLNITSVTATTHDGNLPQNTIDGNLNTRWSAEGFGQYIIFDLGSVKDISAMGIAYYQGSKRSSYYDILVSEDGEEWTKLVSDAESSGKSDDLENFELVTKARYVKYYGYGNSQGKWNSLSEVAIYSK